MKNTAYAVDKQKRSFHSKELRNHHMADVSEWIIVEEIPLSSIFPWAYAWRGWIVPIRKYLGAAFSKGVAFSVKGGIKHAYIEREGTEMAKIAIEKMRDEKLAVKVETDTNAVMKQAEVFWNTKLIPRDLAKKSDKELLTIYDEANALIEELYGVGLVPSTMDMGHNLFTEMLQGYVEKQIKAKKLNTDIGEVFSALTTVEKKTIQQEQEETVLQLLAEINEKEEWEKAVKENKWQMVVELKHKIENLSNEYGWLSRGYEGPILWTPQYFADLLKSELEQGTNAKEKLAASALNQKSLLAKQKQYETALEINDDYTYWFKLARKFTILKNERKDVVLQLYWHLDKLMREISKRLSITEKQSKYILPGEMPAALLAHKFDVNVLNERKTLSYILVTENKISIVTGKEAAAFLKKAEGETQPVNELLGQCACPGIAIGAVKIINSPSELNKMKPGDIMVSHATEPNLVQAMKIAGAIVTDHGGITSHAAIVSRELGKPCVIGTKVATKVFKDGDRVSVDAAKGIIKKIS